MSSLFVITELLNQRSLYVRSFSFRPVYLFYLSCNVFFCQWKLKVSIRHLLTLMPLMYAFTYCFLCTVDYALMLLSSPSLHFSAVSVAPAMCGPELWWLLDLLSVYCLLFLQCSVFLTLQSVEVNCCQRVFFPFILVNGKCWVVYVKL